MGKGCRFERGWWGGVLLALAGTLHAQTPAPLFPIANLFLKEARTTMTIQGVGARPMGLGNAFTAVADDATAVSYNPAGLAQLIEPECTFVGYHARRSYQDSDYRFAFQGRPLTYGQDAATFQTTQPLFAAYTLPLRIWGRNVVVQASHQRLFDMEHRSESQPLVVDAAGQTVQRSVKSISQDGRMNVASLAIAADLTPRLLAGFSLNRWRGQWTSSGAHAFDASPLGPASGLRVDQTNAIRGTQWSLGLIWRSENLQLGYTYRAPFLADFNFAARLDATVAGTAPGALTSAGSVGLRWPGTMAFGMSWRPIPRWMVAADWTRTDWSSARFESDRSELTGMNFFDLRADTRTPSARSLHLGTEFLALHTPGVLVPLRLGWFREPQPDVDTVTGAQRIRHGWSAGLGVRRGRASLDVAWTDARSDRSVSDAITDGTGDPPALGRERIREQRLYVSLGVRFDRDETYRILQWLLVGR